jgi:plasmid stabilization system protein ParE
MRDIWRNIAVHDERAADKLLRILFDKFELVSNHPEMGPARPEIAENVRFIIEGNYIAIYEPAPYGIEVVAIVHARRDPAYWLKED